MLNIIEVTNNKDFFNLRDEWNELVLNSESNNIFLAWEWLFNWWTSFNKEKKLKILLLRENDELIGIAPLFLCKSKRKNTYQIRFMGSTDVGSDYLDFISKKGSENEVINEIFKYLNLNKDNWQIINLTDIPSKSESIGLMKKHYDSNYYTLIQKYTTCPYLPLPESHEIFLSSLSSNMRYNIKRKRRKFEQELKGQFIVVREKNEIHELYEEMVRLNLNRMKIKKIDSPFNKKSFYQFHKNIISYFVANDWLRLCFLKIKGYYIASLYIFKYGGRYYYYQSGFDPDWEKLSPGFLLFSYCIENAISEGIKEFDFLQGEEEYKYLWTNKTRTNLNVKVYRKFFRNAIRYMVEKNKPIVKSKIKTLFLSVNLKDLIFL